MNFKFQLHRSAKCSASLSTSCQSIYKEQCLPRSSPPPSSKPITSNRHQSQPHQKRHRQVSNLTATIRMYCRFFVAVVLILQTMASAAPSSSSEAGAHLRRRQAKPDPCIASPVLCRCEVNLPAHHENDGSTSRWRCFVAPSFLESATLLTFPIVTSRISLCSAAKVVHSLPVIYQSLKMAIHISCHLGTFASVTFILKHSSEKNLHREV
ncbi:hypothetical protein PSHT_10235 [Puccinia striiformis]|uniref:Uncharacterized protein n=1 Tax=Puccinia striiformis TaxID=27350 RepID=A0A2S4VBE1_9BASI|nr:hypothetical protein PSHT_10235 [Puccinia striiformis]